MGLNSHWQPETSAKRGSFFSPTLHMYIITVSNAHLVIVDLKKKKEIMLPFVWHKSCTTWPVCFMKTFFLDTADRKNLLGHQSGPKTCNNSSLKRGLIAFGTLSLHRIYIKTRNACWTYLTPVPQRYWMSKTFWKGRKMSSKNNQELFSPAIAWGDTTTTLKVLFLFNGWPTNPINRVLQAYFL